MMSVRQLGGLNATEQYQAISEALKTGSLSKSAAVKLSKQLHLPENLRRKIKNSKYVAAGYAENKHDARQATRRGNLLDVLSNRKTSGEIKPPSQKEVDSLVKELDKYGDRRDVIGTGMYTLKDPARIRTLFEYALFNQPREQQEIIFDWFCSNVYGQKTTASGSQEAWRDGIAWCADRYKLASKRDVSAWNKQPLYRDEDVSLLAKLLEREGTGPHAWSFLHANGEKAKNTRFEIDMIVGPFLSRRDSVPADEFEHAAKEMLKVLNQANKQLAAHDAEAIEFLDGLRKQVQKSLDGLGTAEAIAGRSTWIKNSTLSYGFYLDDELRQRREEPVRQARFAKAMEIMDEDAKASLNNTNNPSEDLVDYGTYNTWRNERHGIKG